MAPVVQLVRLVWSGTLFDKEGWSCSVHLHNEGAAVPMPALSYEAAIAAWVGRATSHISNQAKLVEVKFNRIDPTTGRYTEPTSNNAVVFPTVAGVQLPCAGQVAMAVSLRTAVQRGRGHMGRFYAPTGITVATVAADGRVSLGTAQGIRDSAKTLLDDLNAVDPMFKVVVFSKAGQLVHEVTGVGVGRVPDTMRSRRRSLDEAPEIAALA